MTIQTTTPEVNSVNGMLLAHAGFRTELGRLARVAAEPLDATRTRLAEEQIDMVVRLLHHHHTIEDELIWPRLRELAPACVGDLDLLEAEHEQVDPLIEAVADASTPLVDRAAPLQQLHELLNAHLDREERVALPLIRTQLPAQEWREVERRAEAGVSRSELPRLACWMLGAADPELRTAVLAEQPAPMRALLRVFWAPAYARRVRRLYGAEPAARAA